MTRRFAVWVKEVRSLTIVAVLASVFATAVVGATLALAHRALMNPSDLGTWGLKQGESATISVTLLVLVAILLTLASVLQSLLRKVDALLVRRRLRDFVADNGLVAPRRAMAERFLMEGWTLWVSSVVQAVGFSVILIWLGNGFTFFGIAAALMLAARMSQLFFKKATKASVEFLKVQQQLNAKPARRQLSETKILLDSAESRLFREGAFVEAVYRRDNEAFRLSAGMMAILSIGILILPVIPALLSISADLPIFLIVLLMWRQRLLDAVTTIGPFAWTLAIWRRSGEGPGAVDVLGFE